MNVRQYSNNQKRAVTKLMSLQRNTTSGKQGGFSNWSNVSEAPFESVQERRQVLLHERIDEDAQRILRTARQNREIADKRIMYDHLGLHEETRKLHHRFLINNIANNYEVPNIPLRGVNAAFLHAENYQCNTRTPEYDKYDQATSILPSKHKITTSIKDGKEIPNYYTSLLGWHVNKHDDRRPDITKQYTQWLRLLYSIGALMLQACIVMSWKKVEADVL